jgi:transmembrane sensor
MADLIKKHRTNALSDQERIDLNELIESSESNRRLFEKLTDVDAVAKEVKLMSDFDEELAWKKFQVVYPAAVKRISMWKYAAAASILAVAVCWYFLNDDNRPQLTEADIKPSGLFRALLKRENSPVIRLDEIANGLVGYIGSLALLKNDSQLIYPASPEMAFQSTDTVETLKGSYYKVQLPDGSNVWLNSTSTIRFPTSFAGQERNVAVNGEAFFEVAKDPNKPFKVRVPDMEIQVIGTRFNVKAYKEDGVVKTTLFDGRVKVKVGSQTAVLSPGEQAVLMKNKRLKKIKDNNAVEQAKAWKQHKFDFNGDDLKTIMNELGRWYGYEIKFIGDFSIETYTGIFQRTKKLSDILNYLHKQTNYTFTIDEAKKEITVTP